MPNRQSQPHATPPSSAGSLDALIAPDSVAVIGASQDPSRIGGRPIRYMREAGFTGAIYPVNPKRAHVQGLPSYADIGMVPGQVDLAIIAVPAPKVADVLDACVKKNVKAAVIYSAGFAEIDKEGQRRQDAIREVALDSGIRVLGPNCLGVYNSDRGLFATFSTTLESRFPHPGPISLVSQSGAYASHLSLLATQRGMGIRYWLTTGNEADITVSECIEWMADREEVSVIMAYAEGINAPDALVRALEKARARRKPVVFMKVGTSAAGAQAARAHTASTAGLDSVCDAILRQYGAFRARTTEEMLDIAYVASFGTLPRSRRVALLTISGGVGVQMADAASQAELDVAPMREEAQTQLKRDLPFASPRNPVDITAQAFNNINLISENLNTILADDRYDSVVAFFTYVACADGMVEPIRESLRAAKLKHPDCLFALSIVGPRQVIESYEAAGCPVFEDPTRAVRAVAAMATIREWLDEPASLASDARSPGRALQSGQLGARDATSILAAAGIPLTAPASLTAREGEPAVEGIDVIVGVVRDVTFGPIVTIRLGGPVAEVLGDISMRRVPFDEPEAHRMIRELKSFPLLAGREERSVSDSGTGRCPDFDLPALAAALARLSEFAAGTPNLERLQLDPLRVFPNHGGVIALNAVIVGT